MANFETSNVMEIELYTDEYFMREALKEAYKAVEIDEVPVGAVIVIRNKIIARSHNHTELLNDFTAHAEMLGITSAGMSEAIISDIVGMIDKGYRRNLEGYILCLSRIVKHDMAWDCITVAFAKQKESVPAKYYQLFNKTRNG